MHLVQKDLNKVKQEWNCHRIRPSRHSSSPAGYPNVLFSLPEIQGIVWSSSTTCMITQLCNTAGTRDYLCTVENRDILVAEEYTEEPDPPGSLEFLEVAQTIMDQEQLEMPSTVQEALNLYVVLTTTIEERCNEYYAQNTE